MVTQRAMRELGCGPGCVSQPRAHPLCLKRWLWGLLTQPGTLFFPPTLLSPPRTQMTSWWPRPSVRATTRT